LPSGWKREGWLLGLPDATHRTTKPQRKPSTILLRLLPRLLPQHSRALRVMPPLRAASAEEAAAGPVDVAANIAAVRAQIDESWAALKDASRRAPPTLVAVSKTKPLALVAKAVAAGQVDFGENYIRELADKAAAVAAGEGGEAKAGGIRWHFIGNIQSNKAKLLCGAPGLWMVHSCHSTKTAQALQKACAELRPDEPPLKVMVQVNTSAEESKGGCEPDEAPAVAAAIDEAPNLELAGCMCIGKYSGSEGDASPDFLSLVQVRTLLLLLVAVVVVVVVVVVMMLVLALALLVLLAGRAADTPRLPAAVPRRGGPGAGRRGHRRGDGRWRGARAAAQHGHEPRLRAGGGVRRDARESRQHHLRSAALR